jgi:ketosteroid isomerase-like protein
MDYCKQMVEERMRLQAVLDAAELVTIDDAIAFGDALTKIIWNHQMLGLVYQYYTDDAVLKGPTGNRIIGQKEIQDEYLSMIAAFPDIRVHITETFATFDKTDGFMVFQRSYCEGTNTGMSIYGPPTGNVLNEQNSLGQTVYLIRKIDGAWKVVNEYSIRSMMTIRNLLMDKVEA